MTISCSTNDKKLKFLDGEKHGKLFKSEHLLKILEVTASVKTRIAIIMILSPRLIDPKQHADDILALFRFVEDKAQVEEALKSRAITLDSKRYSSNQNLNGLESTSPSVMQLKHRFSGSSNNLRRSSWRGGDSSPLSFSSKPMTPSPLTKANQPPGDQSEKLSSATSVAMLMSRYEKNNDRISNSPLSPPAIELLDKDDLGTIERLNGSTSPNKESSAVSNVTESVASSDSNNNSNNNGYYSNNSKSEDSVHVPLDSKMV